MPRPRGPFWEHVTLLSKNEWSCKFCGHRAKGGITRIRAHLTGSPRYGIISCKGANPQETPTTWQATESMKSAGNLEGSSTFTQGLRQLGSASNENDRRETASAPTLYDAISTAGTISLPFVSVHETNFPNQSAQTMIQQLQTPSQPQFTQSHAVDFDMDPCNWHHPSSSQDFPPVALASIRSPLTVEVGNLHTQVPQGEMPRATYPLSDWGSLNEYVGGQHFAGDGGYHTHGCTVVNDQVVSEAVESERAVELSSNVEGSADLTQGPYQPMYASNGDAQRDTSFATHVVSTAVVGSSAFVSVPEMNIPSRSCSAQTLPRQSHPQLQPQSLQSPPGDSNTRCPLNAEVEVQPKRKKNAEVERVNTEVRQGELPQVTNPLSDCVDVPNEYARGPFIREHCTGDGGCKIHGYKVVNGGVRSEAIHALKRRRVVDSSNRQGNGEGSANMTQDPHLLDSASNEDAWRATSFAAPLISTARASSSAFVSVPEMNLPNQSHSAQNMIPQRDFPLRPPFSRTHAGDFDMSYSSNSLDLTPEALPNVWCQPNAEVGALSTKVPQGASTELVSAEGEPSTCGLTDENRTSYVTKREEFEIRLEAAISTLRSKLERIIEEYRRSPTTEKEAEVEEEMKKFEKYVRF